MAFGDLTTLANVRGYIGITDPALTSDDALLTRLVSAESRAFKTLTRRELTYQSYSEVRNGAGTAGITPFQYPVVSVTSVLVDGTTIPQQPTLVAGQTPSPGWVIANDRIEIVRYTSALTPYAVEYDPYYFGIGGPPFTFTRGFGNVTLTYVAGFAAGSNNEPLEAATIPSGSPYTVQAARLFVLDLGVNFTGGAALTKVTSSPAASQYSVSASGLYTFNSVDQGKAIQIAYAFIPSDVEQAVIEMVALRYREKGHIGQTSAILPGGASVSFLRGSVPPSVQDVIDRYTRVNI